MSVQPALAEQQQLYQKAHGLLSAAVSLEEQQRSRGTQENAWATQYHFQKELPNHPAFADALPIYQECASLLVKAMTVVFPPSLW
jgi:hypothetical protein